MPESNSDAPEKALETFELKPISSAENINQNFVVSDADEDVLSLNAVAPSAETNPLDRATNLKIGDLPNAEALPETVEDPIFKALSEPSLPELPRENRARLQMQSPNRIHFYWSFRQNPFQILRRAVGSRTNYQLIVKLVNETNGREELFPADAEGSAWFDADADSVYRAEVGFYAASRPFVRLSFSNRVRTPRKNPSPRRDYAERFDVSADQFARVLDASGYRQDAFEVALAGDDIPFADDATENAVAQIFNDDAAAANVGNDFDRRQSGEWRFVLLALASGYEIETLRAHVDPSLYRFLSARAAHLSREKALAALRENFGVAETDETEETTETFGAAVFGASSINFPRASQRRLLPKFAPLSSLR